MASAPAGVAPAWQPTSLGQQGRAASSTLAPDASPWSWEQSVLQELEEVVSTVSPQDDWSACSSLTDKELELVPKPGDVPLIKNSVIAHYDIMKRDNKFSHTLPPGNCYSMSSIVLSGSHSRKA